MTYWVNEKKLDAELSIEGISWGFKTQAIEELIPWWTPSNYSIQLDFKPKLIYLDHFSGNTMHRWFYDVENNIINSYNQPINNIWYTENFISAIGGSQPQFFRKMNISVNDENKIILTNVDWWYAPVNIRGLAIW